MPGDLSQGASGRQARYRIEYLRWAEAKASVCATTFCDSSLAAAVLQARIGATLARIQHRANGFQIHDDWQRLPIVASERFWGFEGLVGLASM